MNVFEQFKSCVSRIFREAPYVHFRERGVHDFADLVGLIDRFIDGQIRYGLEWDDFISWKQENPNVEAIRQRIGSHERLLFSKSPEDRTAYVSVLIEERNRAAAFVGIRAREDNMLARRHPSMQSTNDTNGVRVRHDKV